MNMKKYKDERNEIKPITKVFFKAVFLLAAAITVVGVLMSMNATTNLATYNLLTVFGAGMIVAVGFIYFLTVNSRKYLHGDIDEQVDHHRKRK
jgi:heme/copper-type cytochrome/quinol oxidase subunit 4